MAKESAGILLYRTSGQGLQVFLVHPGGPFWVHKDLGIWSIPKGELDENEDHLTAARREFEEETGHKVEGPFLELAPVKLKSGKVVYAWAIEGDLDPDKLESNTFQIEWPPNSGKTAQFPEIDRGAWFDLDEALRKINPAQAALINELVRLL
jgi:predicted NUDIX family NTP pyrophosphohydrolase